MKISTKGRYAVEIMADLAVYTNEEKLESLNNIARRRGLSEKYLERIVRRLKEHQLIRSVRGVYGGYKLCKAPEQISVHEVLTAVEGELTPVECLVRETNCEMPCDLCPTKETWNEMWHKIINVVKEVTIADIVELSRNGKK